MTRLEAIAARAAALRPRRPRSVPLWNGARASSSTRSRASAIVAGREAGRTIAQIAAQLGVCPATIRNDVNRLGLPPLRSGKKIDIARRWRGAAGFWLGCAIAGWFTAVDLDGACAFRRRLVDDDDGTLPVQVEDLAATYRRGATMINGA